MPRQKRTAEELRIAILEKIKEMDDNADEHDINKTTIANAVGINNTLVTSLLDGMEKNEMVKRDGFGNYRILDGGNGLLEIIQLGYGKAWEILKISRRIARMDPINNIEVIKRNEKAVTRQCVFCGVEIGENDDISNRHCSECEWIKLGGLVY